MDQINRTTAIEGRSMNGISAKPSLAPAGRTLGAVIGAIVSEIYMVGSAILLIGISYGDATTDGFVVPITRIATVVRVLHRRQPTSGSVDPCSIELSD